MDSLNIYVLLIVLKNVIYYLIPEAFFNGASFGKMLLSIRISNQDESKVSVLKLILRLTIKVLTGLFIPLYLVGFITSKKQAIHDLITGTVVINKNDKNELK